MKKIIRIALLLFYIYLSFGVSAGENKAVDSLKTLLQNEENCEKRIEILIELSNEMQYLASGKALGFAREAYNLSVDNGIPHKLAKSAATLGSAFFYNRKLDSSFYYQKMALDLYLKNQDEAGIVSVYTSLGNYYSVKNLSDSALKYFNKALNIAIKQKNEKKIATVLINLGALYSDYIDDYPTAEAKVLEALEIAKKLKDNKLQASAHYNLGVIRDNMGDAVAAEEYFLKALDYFQKNNYTQKQQIVCLNLGVIFFEIENYKKAKTYFDRLLKVSIETDYKTGQAAAYHNIASILQEEQKIDSAIGNYYLARDINIETGNTYWLSNNYSQLAVCYSVKNDFEQAYQYAYTLIGIANQLKDSSLLAEDYKILAEIHKKNNLPDSALLYFNLSNRFSRLFQMPEVLSSNYHNQALIYSDKQKYKKAFDYLKKHKILADSIVSQEKADVIEELEVRYNVEKKSLELEKRKTRILNLESINKTKKIRILILIFSLFIIIAVSVVLLYVVNRRNSRQTERLVIEKQTIEKDKKIKELELKKLKSELNHKTELILEKNKFIQEIKEELTTVKGITTKNNEQLNRISELLSARILTPEHWNSFKKTYELVHPEFIPKMRMQFDKLTETEIRLACLIKLKLSNKEIGEMLGISHESVLKSRYRLKKKLKLEDENIDDFIINL